MIVRIEGMDEVIKKSTFAHKYVKRATKSALGSVGYDTIQDLKKQIQTKGSHAGTPWKKQHPLTRIPKQRTGKRQRLTLRQNRPLSGLKRFTRYRVSDTAVQILFARSKKGKVGSFDRLMNDFILRSEKGETQALTGRSRRWRAARGFAVRKSRSTITIPKRPVISAVYNKNKGNFLPLFEKKFNASLERQIQ